MMDVGATYTSSFAVLNDSGNPADAATVALTVTNPDQTTDSFTLDASTVTRDGLGLYHVDYVTDQEGLYKFAWVTTGPSRSSSDFASASVFRSIIGIDEARTYIGETDTSRDDILRQVMMALTEKIESIVGICVPKTFTDDHISANSFSSRQVLKLPNGPLLSATSVVSVSSVWADGPIWTLDELIVYPDTATVEANSFVMPFWYGPWKATYTAGRMVIPQAFQLALKESIFDFWASQRPYGPDQLAPGMDDTSRWETALAAYDLPPHAKSLLESYELPGFA